MTGSLDAAAAGRSEGRRFASFVVTGGVAAAVNLLIRWLLSKALLYELAVTIAYLVGMTTAFLLARRYVFSPGDRTWFKDYSRFAVVNAVSFLVVLSVSVGLARIVFPMIGLSWHAEDLAHLVGVISPVALSYYAHKHYSFGTRKHQP